MFRVKILQCSILRFRILGSSANPRVKVLAIAILQVDVRRGRLTIPKPSCKSENCSVTRVLYQDSGGFQQLGPPLKASYGMFRGFPKLHLTSVV